MTRGRAVLVTAISFLMIFVSGWIAWNGLVVYWSDMYAGITFVCGLAIGIGGAWLWRWE